MLLQLRNTYIYIQWTRTRREIYNLIVFCEEETGHGLRIPLIKALYVKIVMLRFERKAILCFSRYKDEHCTNFLHCTVQNIL
jgi:hypothetical protein